MSSPLNDVLAGFSRKYRKKAKQVEPLIQKYLDEGMTSAQAVDKALKETDFKAYMTKAVKDAMLSSAVIGAGSYTAGKSTPLDEAWDPSGMTLSEKLHGTSKAMRNHIINTIKEQLKQGDHAMKSARALYDGYNTTDNVVRKQMLPKYLQDVVNFSRRSDLGKNDVIALQKLVRKARRMVDRLAQNGAPNRALKTSYKELLDAVESCSDKALKRAIRTAVEEKSRYVAERIARTESARAWYQGFLKDTMDDPDVVAYRWVESTRHPTEDICDEYAHVDMYGLGKGVFPKDKAPELPAHPHCLCHYEKVYATELSVNLRLNNKAVVRRNVLFPFDETDAVGIPREITNKLAETFDSIEENYNIDKPVLISVEFLNNEKVPLQYQGLKIGNVISHRIVINSNFNWGNIDTINQKLEIAHEAGQLAAKNVEGLAVHKMGHFLTYFDCNDDKMLVQREKDIQSCCVKGITKYSDDENDGAECLEEAFVKLYNKEKVPNQMMLWVEKYILKWRQT